jgi:L-threonylcarbamoyladenylate synthase
MAEELAELNPLAERVFKEKMPGPLTLVLKARGGGASKLLLAGTGKIGVRVPDHPVALKLIELFGGPITATSANISGKPAPKTAQAAMRQLGKKVDFAIDAGRCRIGRASTDVDLCSETPKIIRGGPISSSELRSLWRKLRIRVYFARLAMEAANTPAPNPLSMFTTDTFGEHVCSIVISAPTPFRPTP